MGKEEMDLDDLGLSDEELGLGTSRAGAGGTAAAGVGGGDRRRGRRRGALLFLLGVALGAAGALFLPRAVGPHLPAGIRGGGETVEGRVVGKRLDGDRLLLTVTTERGAVLATFRERVAEIDLLIEEGDSVALGLGRYRPFVDDPAVAAVRKAEAGERSPGGDTTSPAEPAGGATEAGDGAAGQGSSATAGAVGGRDIRP